jgi:fatty acid-binding protein DegV
LKKNNLLDLPHIKEVVNYYAQNIAAALVTRDLSFLINGGRIKKVTGMIAKLLNIIPINSFDREGVTQRLKVMKIDKIPNAIEKYFSTFLNDFK